MNYIIIQTSVLIVCLPHRNPNLLREVIMAEYKVPLNEMSFLLYEVFKADEMWQKLPKLAEQVDKDTAQAILQECAKIAEQELDPIARQGDEIGVVTSGTAGPTKGSPIAMGYVQTQYAVLETEIFAEVRGKKLPMLIQKMPFVEQRNFRG